MKIGILTLPLHTNYGGNLQAYALMVTLKNLGHDVWLINREENRIPHWKFPLVIGKRLLKKYLLNKKDIIIFNEKKQQQEFKIISINSKKFIGENIQPQTTSFSSSRDLSKSIEQYQFDAIIVGSDQVWRPMYTPNIEDYFLKFLGHRKIKRISYAASFGSDIWEFSIRQEKSCAALLKQFDAVSVRESSGVKFCEKYFNVKAEHVLDPTMLLSTDKYLNLIKDFKPVSTKKGGLLVYILDESQDKIKVIKKISSELNLIPFRVNSKTEDYSAPVDERVAPPTEQWIKGFDDADYILTDSFHACVFSILFNKPFIVYANKNRGVARFTSLLTMFNLENRLIYSFNELTIEKIHSRIEWEIIESTLRLEREKAISFLSNNLL